MIRYYLDGYPANIFVPTVFENYDTTAKYKGTKVPLTFSNSCPIVHYIVDLDSGINSSIEGLF